MCSNYEAVSREDRLLSFFGVEVKPGESVVAEIWPTGLAPFIRRDEQGRRELRAGHFGLLPHFAKEVTFGRKTYNARSETVHQLASFKTAWSRGQRCIVPAEAVYEPCWETGQAVRWRIQHAGGVPMGIGGIWYEHPWLKDRHDAPLLSFAMLTVNADGHPVFKRMHRPGDEKRMVLIIDAAEYDRWLQCSPAEAATFFRPWAGLLDAFAAPPAPRAKKAVPPPPFWPQGAQRPGPGGR